MACATLTSKGQVTIPKEVRERLHLATGDKVEFTVQDDGTCRLAPRATKVADLFGMLRREGERPVGVDEARRRMAGALRRRT